MAEAAIEAHALGKQYGSVTAIKHIDLRVQAHSIYALLGPNGAGKTTTMNILTTLTMPTAGSASVAGYNVVTQPHQVRQRIGVTFQDIVLDVNLTGWHVLDVHGQLYHIPRQERKKRIAHLVELVQLEDAINRRVKTYSGGMKRRLELARGLLTHPDILFLDEPTQGLDPQNRVGIWEYIRRLNHERGLTVLLTTHQMEEAETLAHTVGIVDQGRMVAEGTASHLIAALDSERIRIQGSGDQQHFLSQIATVPFVKGIEHDPTTSCIQIYVDNSTRRLAEVMNMANSNGFCVEEINVTRPGLGDVFLHHTGRALRD
jgi:ABC-2 type transport system ATP-binding protein